MNSSNSAISCISISACSKHTRREASTHAHFAKHECRPVWEVLALVPPGAPRPPRAGPRGVPGCRRMPSRGPCGGGGAGKRRKPEYLEHADTHTWVIEWEGMGWEWGWGDKRGLTVVGSGGDRGISINTSTNILLMAALVLVFVLVLIMILIY